MNTADRRSPPWRDGAMLALVAFAVYAFAGRTVFHGSDMYGLLWGFQRGIMPHHAYSTFYMPWLGLTVDATAPFGVGVFRAALLTSATGAALAVGLAWCASRTLGLDRGTAFFATLLFASTPAVTYFATVPELHAPALAFCGIAWLAIAHWAHRPGFCRAALVGGSLVLAFLAHPTAVALGGAMLPIALLRRGAVAELRRRDLLVGFAIAALILVAGILAVPPLLRRGGLAVDAGGSLHYLMTRAGQMAELERLPRLAWNEWLLPFLPVSVALLALSFRRPWRSAAIAAQLAVVPFLGIAWLMFESFDYERGAYTSAITWPLVAVVASACRPTWLRVVLLAVSLGTSIVLYRGLQEPPRTRATAEAVRQAIGDRQAFWMLGSLPDAEAWFTRCPRVEVVLLSDLMVLEADTLRVTLANLDTAFAERTARGELSLVTSTALELCNSLVAAVPNARLLLTWLEQRRGPELAHVDDVICFALRPTGH